MERKLIQSNGKFSIILKCKDFKLLSLEFETVEAMNSVASSIEQLSNIGKCHFELHILTQKFTVNICFSEREKNTKHFFLILFLKFLNYNVSLTIYVKKMF